MAAELIPDMVEVATLLVEATKPMRAGRGAARFAPVMRALSDAGRRGLTQIQLASILGMNPASMSRTIDMLERSDMLVRVDHPLDRRCKVIQLTDKGRDRLEQCAHSQQGECDRMFRGLGEQDLATLKTLLRQVVNNLGLT